MKHAEALTVETLIRHLVTLPADTALDLSAKADSYRGYYNHVAIAPGSSAAAELLEHLRSKLDTTMQGYKGGEYTFAGNCYVFVADYGDCGPQLALMGDELVTVNDTFVW